MKNSNIDNYTNPENGIVKKRGFVPTDRKPTEGKKNADFYEIGRF